MNLSLYQRFLDWLWSLYWKLPEDSLQERLVYRLWRTLS